MLALCAFAASVAGCEDGPRAFPWPGVDAGGPSWDLAPIVPARASLDVKLVTTTKGANPRSRRDSWTFERPRRDTARVVHHVVYEEVGTQPRQEREEALLVHGRLTTRTGEGPWLARSSDERLHWLLNAPERDLASLMARGGAGASRPSFDMAEDLVRGAALTLAGPGWQAEYRYRAEQVATPPTYEAVDAGSPDGVRP